MSKTMLLLDEFEKKALKEHILLIAKLAYKTAVNDTIGIVTKSFGMKDPGEYIRNATDESEHRYIEEVNESGIW